MLLHHTNGILPLYTQLVLTVRYCHMFNDRIVEDHVIAPTNTSGGMNVRYVDGEKYSDADYISTQTFPQDYDFGKESVQYVCGMSVPPVMMANIAAAIYEQWLKD